MIFFSVGYYRKEHPACAMCQHPFEGTKTQRICDLCRSTRQGQEYLRNRAARQRRRWYLRNGK